MVAFGSTDQSLPLNENPFRGDKQKNKVIALGILAAISGVICNEELKFVTQKKEQLDTLQKIDTE